MQESKTYQRQRERILRENTIKHISVVLKTKFPAQTELPLFHQKGGN